MARFKKPSPFAALVPFHGTYSRRHVLRGWRRFGNGGRSATVVVAAVAVVVVTVAVVATVVVVVMVADGSSSDDSDGSGTAIQSSASI